MLASILHTAASKTSWTEYQWKVDAKGVWSQFMQICVKISMDIHDTFVAFNHHQHFWLLPPVLQPAEGKGKSFTLHAGVINSSLLNHVPTQICSKCFATLSTAHKHPEHNPQSKVCPLVFLDMCYPHSLKTQGKHQPLQITSDLLTPLLKTKWHVRHCLSHRDFTSLKPARLWKASGAGQRAWAQPGPLNAAKMHATSNAFSHQQKF